MKIYDCFTFYNEFELLELRLKSYYNLVDCFVIVEADKTQSNKPKPFYFNERKNEFAEFLPKIRHIMVQMEIPYSGVGDWSIEFAQRDFIAKGLSDAEPEDLIFISDLDEFWAPDIFQRLQENRVEVFISYLPNPDIPRVNGAKIIIPCAPLTHVLNILESSPIVMNQNMHNYYLNWKTPQIWQGSILTCFKRLTTPQQLRNLRTFIPRIMGGGWHFSWMGGIERVLKKMVSTVEANEWSVKNEKFLDRNYIEKCLKERRNIFNSEEQYNLCDISEINLPYLAEFVKKYPQFIKTEGSF